MKFFLLVMLLSTMIFSCKKEKNLGPLFESFIGKWICVNTNSSSYYEITRSGYFSFSNGIERNVRFEVFFVNIINPSSINEVDWNGIQFIDEKTSIDGIFYFNETMDTITITSRIIDENGNFNSSLPPINYYYIRQ